MSRTKIVRQRFDPLIAVVTSLRAAFRDLLDQELRYSAGHLTAIANTCLFAPSLLTFWFVNGVLDFSTALAIGAVATPAGLQVRLVAYLLLVPTFLLGRIVVHMLLPTHRAQLLSGSCPNTRLMSLDWFSTGILATGLPLAVQNLGPWLATNVVLLVGLFVAPQFVPDGWAPGVRIGAIVAGVAMFLYANYGAMVPFVPDPASILGPVATLTLTPAAVDWLLGVFNSILFGPAVVGLFGVTMNHILTRPELADVPVLRHGLPRRDPDLIVAANAASGTLFYLVVVAAVTGRVILVP